MAFQEKQLGQTRSAATAPVSVYSPAVGTDAVIKHVTLCNTTNAGASYSLFLDADGTTYDQSTAMAYDIPIPGNSFVFLNVFWPMSQASGNFAYRTSTANAVTVTVNGAEIT